jgi:hypothetical protein
MLIDLRYHAAVTWEQIRYRFALGRIRVRYWWTGLWSWIAFGLFALAIFAFAIAVGKRRTELAVRAFSNVISNQELN